jgi:hypothetical protein
MMRSMRWTLFQEEGTTAAAPSGGAAAKAEDPRRAPRMAVRCRVVVRGRAASWIAETEDLGPGGCQLVTSRYEDAGPEIALAIASPLVARPLVATGRVVWLAEATAHARLGVAFAAGAGAPGAILPADWFARVFAGTPGATVRDAVRSVAIGATIHLAQPPARLPPLQREHVRLLRAVGAGATVDALRGRVGAPGFEAALFSLLSHRCLTLARAAAAPPGAWARALDAADAALARAEIARARASARREPAPAPAPTAPVGAVRRSPEAQRLYERGVELLVAGNASEAARLFRAAFAAAPADPVLRGVLARFA